MPISLYVSVEVIRYCQSLLIDFDKKMYYEPKDAYAKARTTTLNEELGQVEYVFSDKTGTLTQNLMTFNKCSIAGVLYGDVIDPVTGECADINQQENAHLFELLDFSNDGQNKYYEEEFKFYDQNLLDQIHQGNKEVHEFFRLLALCHTVMSEEKDGRLEYQAQSPDEAALSSAARNFGFVFKNRTSSTIEIEVLGKTEIYELLAILDFNNVRKRMSVIVRDQDNKITLYCKGADSVIFEHLGNESGNINNNNNLTATPTNLNATTPTTNTTNVKEATNDHLERFAGVGLRTLCLAKKDLDEDTYAKWEKHFHQAVTAIDNREEKVDKCYEMIEQNLQLLGATAIEDKLQDDVPKTIANLISANIKVWVLTGDKQETAINIGFSCELLNDEMTEIFVIDGVYPEEVDKQLRRCQKSINKFHHQQQQLKNQHHHHHHHHPQQQRQSSEQLSEYHNQPNHNQVRSPSKIFINNNNNSILYQASSSENSLNKTTTETVPNSSTRANTTNIERGPSPLGASGGGLGGFALVINGHSLAHALCLSREELFLNVACQCKSVICCRVTPLQKALVVDLVKRRKKVITLSIGDGANDVSMLKMAHIGVGISGQEGMQAVLASDYAIAQFSYLERLILVHGRWSYFRMCKFLRYFFYKNFSFTLCNLWYAFFCGFSAQVSQLDL